MSYYAPSTYSVDDKASHYSRVSSQTHVSSWGTIPDTASGHSLPRIVPISYPTSPSNTPLTNHHFLPQSQSPCHPSLSAGSALSLNFDLFHNLPPRLPFDQAAFNPPIYNLTLEFPDLPGSTWSIPLTSPSNSPGLTLHHLLSTIHRYFYSELRRDQSGQIPPQTRQRAGEFCQRRSARQRQPAVMLIVDVLCEKTLFAGISPKTPDLNVWVVHFCRSPLAL